ncbi:MAG: serine hydrolase [Gammaproteobacteria bacterium]|nr:serine hydrolase [Gammaproteobacteria bacterium]
MKIPVLFPAMMLAILAIGGTPAGATDLARAKALELPTTYAPPPGDPLSHHAAGFAKVMCSAVFITGVTPEFAARNVGYFTAPLAERSRLGNPTVDRDRREVRIRLPDGGERIARYTGDQGCVSVPAGDSGLHFAPITLRSLLPDPARQPWPTGDVLSDEPLPAAINADKLRQAMDAAFAPAESMTAALVVTWRGRIIAERYGPGVTAATPLESWSMGKSLTATLMGVLIQQGIYTLDQPAPIPEWQSPGDPRATIRIRDLLSMSSGLRIRAPLDPDFDPAGPYPDHLYLYTGGENIFHYAATRPLQWPPATVGRYRNTDPVLVNYLVRLALEKRGEEYLSFPRRALFDRIGVRNLVMETDAWGNFLTQGYQLGSARDWARLGNLYLQDGVCNGERILPEGFVKFVSTPAPAWVADGNPIYGGFFWLNTDRGLPLPEDAYYMSGVGHQYTIIVPSLELVIVRLGHFGGEHVAEPGLLRALSLLREAISP